MSRPRGAYQHIEAEGEEVKRRHALYNYKYLYEAWIIFRFLESDVNDIFGNQIESFFKVMGLQILVKAIASPL